ncbi:NPCBM/NEW2 domain-containing protein [Abyssalbus ytuae]|uniref:Alpha-galactosidase n=1 Tax=Abyssalbus ytuae TaxID=2926907 RepID=A0A9E7D2A7_9FLAO|nr:NPCBM/NEW2 domain-containing protein [Abyssalbus ytuae]UOB17963.1 NPCBM/NEW2 domain-containing protein [Abyssalbus ytuae]
MKTINVFSLLIVLALLVACKSNAKKDGIATYVHKEESGFKSWALTPPMGWNSWDCFGPSVVEEEVKANADYMAKHLKDFGWEYVVVDIRWYVDNQTTGHYNAYDKSEFILDEYGRYMPSPKRFPSATNGAGFKPLADYIHSLGLKFGIHIMRGVPKEAVFNKLPVKGTNKTAADIYSTENECTWLKDNYTVVAGKLGAQEYYNSIFDLYAAWGVDFVKVDNLSRPYYSKEIEMIRNAIDQTGRPIVLSMSPGATPIDEHTHATANANMWRTIDDFWDNWAQLNYSFEKCAEWAPYISPGAWPDADMLPMGKFIRGERATNRYTKFTKDEQYTLITLWVMFKSPLMFGGNLPDNDEFTNLLLTNEEVLEVHSKSINNKQWFNKNDLIGWIADDPESGDKFVAIFNSAGDGFVTTKNILYRSGTVSKLTDGFGKDIDIKLPDGSKELYLIVNDGGDGHAYDHANWINPTLYFEDGNTMKLADLTWEEAYAGWGTIGVNKSISEGELNIKGVKYENGIGTHSQSIIRYKLPENTVRFTAFAGLDIGGTSGNHGCTVEFMISNEDPTPKNENPTKIPVNLEEMGFPGKCTIRDLWQKKHLGTFSGSEFSPTINYHGAGLYRISKAK